MALLDDVKVALRVASDDYDSEIQGLIQAAELDMARVGLEAGDGSDALARNAVVLFCKAHFGYDNSEAPRFLESYRQTVVDMLNSPSTYGGQDEVE